MKHRLLRANELLKREIGLILQRDFTFAGSLVTVHQVSVTPDLRKAHIYLGVIGQGMSEAKILETLESGRKQLQSEMSKRVVLKYTPRLEFHIDHSVARGSRVVEILQEIEPTITPPDANTSADPDDDEDEVEHDPAPVPPAVKYRPS
ncbi:MAG: 30S ribosome-binding factor RbfA [Verrucomicrobiales bacterium]